jgi:hypothetical protein
MTKLEITSVEFPMSTLENPFLVNLRICLHLLVTSKTAASEKTL